MDLCAKEVMYGLVETSLQQSTWTSNVDVFLEWLNSLKFRGANPSEGAVAEALAQALQVLIHTSYAVVVHSCAV